MKHYDQVNTSNNEYRNEYYYNWYAARANPTQCTGPTSSANATTTNDNKSRGDICPKNWSIPADGTGTLQLNNSTFRTTLLNSKSLATFGVFYSGTQNGVGSSGRWWSSTRNSNGNAYNLYLESGSAYRISNPKSNGYSVRCMRSS